MRQSLIDCAVKWQGAPRNQVCSKKASSLHKREAVLLRLVNDIFFLNRIDNLCRPSVQILKPVDVSILRPS